MPVKLLFTIVGFNGLVLVFLAGVVVAYFRPAQFALMTSFFLGWLAAFVNLNSSEPQLPALLLLSFGFFIGFVVQRTPWRYALVIGMFVPISQVVWLGVTHQTSLLLSDGAGSLIALLPSFGGIYLGWFVSRSRRTDDGKMKMSSGAAL